MCTQLSILNLHGTEITNDVLRQAHNNMGSVYVDCDMLDEAAECYTKALGIKHSRAHQGLAHVYYLKNQKKAAYDEMSKLIEKAKNNASAYEKRSEYCERDTAKSDLDMETKLDPLRTYPYRYRASDTNNYNIDQMDLLLEQLKMLAGEVALCTSSLKRLTEQAANHPEDSQIQDQMQELKDGISQKNIQMRVLEQRMVGSYEMTAHSSSNIDISQALAELTTQLSEKTFDLEIMSADNRILQEQLQTKMSENMELQETVALLKQQLSFLSDRGRKSEDIKCADCLAELSAENGDPLERFMLPRESSEGNVPQREHNELDSDTYLKAKVLMQAAEIENLKQEKVRSVEEKDGLEIHSQKLAEEASYAKELAAAAAVELRNLAEEVTKLSCQNAKLTGDVAASKELSLGRYTNGPMHVQFDGCQDHHNNMPADVYLKRPDDSALIEELKKEIVTRCQREGSLEAALLENDRKAAELQRRIDESKQHEEELENELGNMWVLVAKLKRNCMISSETLSEGFNDIDFHQNGFTSSNDSSAVNFPGGKFFDGMYNDHINSLDEVRAAYEYERRQCKELEGIVSRLKGENLDGLDVRALEELQSFHVEALSKICQEKLSNRVL